MDNSSSTEKEGGAVTASSGSNTSGWFWTNERHVHFLNSIEATFVRTMLQNVDDRALPLDRQMPDSLESTMDLGKELRSRHSSSDDAGYSSSSSSVRTYKKNKRLSSHPNDQVVPELENRRHDGNNANGTHRARIG